MLQGTGSNVGKSLLVTGLCRAFARRGLRVRPFKPQNMSNNAAVTPDGGEIGRAQALQARACGVPPSVHMNPVLLKPQTEVGAQVVVQGTSARRRARRATMRSSSRACCHTCSRASRSSAARRTWCWSRAPAARPRSTCARRHRQHGLRRGGGPAGACWSATSTRGGVIAALVGTHALLEPAERRAPAGYLINKFRGDPALFDDAHAVIAARTGMRSYGVVPWFERARLLPAEDALGLHESARAGATARSGSRCRGCGASRISTTSTRWPPSRTCDLRIVAPGEALPGDADLVILPGSKATIADLADAAGARAGTSISRPRPARRRGARHLRRPADAGPAARRSRGHRGAARRGRGAGPARPRDGAGGRQAPARRCAAARSRAAQPVAGYEMHVGRTSGPALARPMLDLAGRPDGAVSADGRIMGCYVHGLFAADGFRHAFLARLRARRASGVAFEQQIEADPGCARRPSRGLGRPRRPAGARPRAGGEQSGYGQSQQRPGAQP